MVNKQLDEYLVQQIISRLILPFDRWPAFKYGIISKEGKVLRKKSTLKTTAEQESWGYLDILACNLRKILSDYPTTKMKLAQLNMIQNAPLPTVIGQPPTIPLSTLAGSFFLLKEGEDLLREGVDKNIKITKTQNRFDGTRYDVEYDRGGGITHNATVRLHKDHHDSEDGYVSVFSDSSRNSFGPGIIRRVMDHIKKDAKIKSFSGKRVSGAGRGRIQKISVDEEKESLFEDAPTNAMGGGAIAGGGIGPQGDPPVRRGTILTKVLRRKAKISVANN